MTPTDVAVVGAGIVGLAHAWAAARRGLSVAVFERSPRASGASVRNFGMVWPIGQPPGPAYDRALRSRADWLDLARRAGVWVSPCGSLHLARQADELAVLEEFAAGAHGVACRMLTPAEALALSPGVVAGGLLGALHSPAECCVDPRQALAVLPAWLAETFGVRFHWNALVTQVRPGRLTTSDGRAAEAGRIVVCAGADFQTLFPKVLAAAGLRRCKLQMMRTAAQPGGWRLGPHLAGGLTLCHYAAFAGCPSLPRLRQRFADEMPACVRFGIHVMASQNHLGEVVIGDSHEYDADISPFDKAEIDDLILAYLRQMVRLPDEVVAARWHGVYAKHPTLPLFAASPEPGVEVRVAPGGAGMTLAFGLAQEWLPGDASSKRR
jgi:FAD dependent oxidoreductase TIGR03364